MWAGVYLILNALLILDEVLEDHTGISGLVLVVDAASGVLTLPKLGCLPGVSLLSDPGDSGNWSYL